MPAPRRVLPDRPSLEQLRKQAKDLRRAARAGDASALARVAVTPHSADPGRVGLAQDFKHEATAAFLLDHGMDPNHMNWHRFTLLHHMAATGELAKAQLLLDHDADIDAIDDEYCSSPLGVAARRGQEAIVELLLARGADPRAAGASWAAPVVWAERKGHRRIADLLRAAESEDASM